MKTLINDQWFFVKLPPDTTAEEADRAEYQPVDLPHDWLIWQENDLYESADVWYRRTIQLPEDHDPVVMVRFDGVYMDCDVLLNDELICTHAYGYTAFDADLTGRVKPGKNLLKVHIRHRSPNTRWYSGSGIYRDVFLITLPEDYLIPDSLYLRETKESSGLWTVEVTAETSVGEQPFSCRLYDPDGGEVSCEEGTRGKEVRACLKVKDGIPWCPEAPFLYTLETRYGKQTEVRKIGLRSVFADAEHGLMLNGRQIRMKGVCLHHDLGALGAAFHEKAARRQLALMKEMGANAIRTSHNPPAAKWLDLCDEMGLLVIDEAFDMWERPKTEYDYSRFFPECYQEDVASWIRRDRCHPCVIMWSIGNEIYDMHADYRGTEITKMLYDEVRNHDPYQHAYITFGCNYMPWEGGQRCAEKVDIVGYNYGEKYYEMHHRKYPSWIIYGSETGSVLSSRGIYHFPISQSIMSDADRQCSALGNSNTSWGAEDLKKIIIEDLRHPFSLGQFIWSGIDYIGEPTPYHTRSCYFGQADTACYPKDAYFLFKRFWTEGCMIHIGVSWDWNHGQMIDVPVITSCDEAELFLNGKSMGRKHADSGNPELSVPIWHIPFEAGILTARGFDKAGRIICEDVRNTPNDTYRLKLSCENEYLMSDGWDLAFVSVSAEDEQGRTVDNARDRMKISVSGGGRLMGTDNGDSTDPDGYKTDCRRLFSGKLLLIIGSNGKTEDVTVNVQGGHGLHAELCIPVRKAAVKKGISTIQQAISRPMTDKVDARRLDLHALTSTRLTADHPECVFEYRILPAEADETQIVWQVTNAAGIAVPHVSVKTERHRITVHAGGNGEFYLRGLCGNRQTACYMISQIEFTAEGMGNPCMDAYSYISAGLYDLKEGHIGTGNEKGIAFARDEESMAGYSCIDFGKTGTDTITVDLFALNDDPYELELWTCEQNGDLHLIETLRYQKPSIWNVYQPETWKLHERLTGIRPLMFRMKDKVHMKGFIFEKQSGAWMLHAAGSADVLYGDSFTREDDTVRNIGNNVTLTWTGMDFEGAGEVILSISGRTPLSVNTITVRICNDNGETIDSALDFNGTGEEVQQFRVRVPEKICRVSFVFLPGSCFDFKAFQFQKP